MSIFNGKNERVKLDYIDKVVKYLSFQMVARRVTCADE